METTADMHRKLAHVPYMQKEQFMEVCKEHGIPYEYDKKSKCWYVRVTEKDNIEPINKWLAPPSIEINKVISEFKSFMEQYGLKPPEDPVMDGEIHRCSVAGSKRGSFDGSYVGHLDGRPSGWIKNYKTGGEAKWKSEGVELTAEQVSAIRKEALSKQTKRKKDNSEKQKVAIQKLQQVFATGKQAQGNKHAYALTKKIHCDPRILIDQKGNLLIPLLNIDKKLRSAQTIKADGTKRYAAGVSKTGHFFVASPPGKSIKDFSIEPMKQKEIYFAEGYATAATIATAMNAYVIVTFDSSNLPIVAKIFAEKLPNQKFIMCADNDKNLPSNVGVNAAKEAAKATHSVVVKPDMGEQIGTDFNDLYLANGGNDNALQIIKSQISTQVEQQSKTLEAETNFQDLSM